MQRILITPRSHWNQKVESLGFTFHSTNEAYWRENATYEFTSEEVDRIEDATNELYRIARETVAHVIEHRRFAELGIPKAAVPLIIRSWQRQEPSLYGRFDLAFNGREEPKLLEFNADTPTSLLEASIIQWQWKQDANPAADQFNSIHERLVARWSEIVAPGRMLHLACFTENDEDLRTVEYLADTAIEAGVVTKILDITEVCWSDEHAAFFDCEGRPIQHLFKLYPWEWLVQDDFAEHLALSDTTFLEPAWKMVLSNKGILPIMWELFPGHPNLLPCYRDPSRLQGQDYVEKPIFSREGNNISIVAQGEQIESTGGSYADCPKVYQARVTLPNFGGTNMILGSWIIGDESAGMGIREDQALITTNLSPFAPHFFR